MAQNILYVIHSNFAPLHHVHESAWRGHEQVTATGQITQLATNIGTTVDDAWAYVWTVSKLKTYNPNHHQLPKNKKLSWTNTDHAQKKMISKDIQVKCL